MAFNFPDNPTLNQVVTGPTGAQYMWDGTKWVPAGASTAAFAPINSPAFTGNPTAPTQPLADSDTSLATTAFVRTGVTDGSNAVAGQVGEYLSVTSAAVSLGNNTWNATASLALSAGDWDVGGTGYINPNSPGLGQIIVGIGTTSAALPPLQNITQMGISATTIGTNALTVPTLRFNLTAPTTVYFNSYVALGTASSCTSTAVIWARRAR